MVPIPKADKIIEALVANPSDVAPVVPRLGWLGMGARDGWRLYLTLDLNHYLEFDRDDLVHAVPLEILSQPSRRHAGVPAARRERRADADHVPPGSD